MGLLVVVQPPVCCNSVRVSRGRQVEQIFQDFTHEQFLQRPLLLHEQHMDILQSQKVQSQTASHVHQQLTTLAYLPFFTYMFDTI